MSGGTTVDLHRDPEFDGPQAVAWQLLNPSDDPAVCAALTTPAARARRILLVRIRPATVHRVHLAYDTLRAIGVTMRDVESQSVEPDELPRRTLYRLCGLRVAVLALDCPHSLNQATLDLARSWCDHLGARLVLISTAPIARPALTTSLDDLLDGGPPRHPPTPAYGADGPPDPTGSRFPDDDAPGTGLRPAPAQWSWGDDGWGRRRPGPDWDGAGRDIDPMSLPVDDFPTFRAACARLPHRQALDHVYTTAYTACATELALPHDARIQDRICTALFHGLTLHDPPLAVRMITLRAIQAAAFTHTGHWIGHDPTAYARPRPESLPGNLVPRHYLGTLQPVLDPLVAVANLLWGYLETDCDGLVMLRDHHLITEDLSPVVSVHPDTDLDDDATPPAATTGAGGPVTAPALVFGTTILQLPPWSLPLLRAYRCQRDHHRNRQPVVDPPLFVRDRAMLSHEVFSQAIYNGPPFDIAEDLRFADVEGTHIVTRGTSGERERRRGIAYRGMHPLLFWIVRRGLTVRDIRPDPVYPSTTPGTPPSHPAESGSDPGGETS
ncbi:hypothetical protein [Saccharothrix hoggarensis]|uniref:Uncharacterized protein n=1 Tax=Saccharothrix hoggarensis TaxID=913853 RepID=A0ABW3QHM2_9PSEU